MGIYPKYARIGKTDHVRNIEDQRKHDDGDEPVTCRVRSQKKDRIHNAIRLIHDRLNLSKETKKRPSQRAGKTYSAVQNNLMGNVRHLGQTSNA